jgi:hypothetical protein
MYSISSCILEIRASNVLSCIDRDLHPVVGALDVGFDSHLSDSMASIPLGKSWVIAESIGDIIG